MTIQKELLEKSIGVLMDKADVCMDLAKNQHASSDRQHEAADKQNDQANKLDSIATELITEAVEIKGEMDENSERALAPVQGGLNLKVIQKKIFEKVT